MTHHDDERLRKEFADLRAEARPSAPDFAAMMAEARRRADERPPLEVVAGGDGRARGRSRTLAWAGAWGSVAVAAAVAALILVGRAPSGDADFERLVAAYSTQMETALSSPTSGLLRVPGMELTRSVPSIGVPVRGLDPSDRPAPQPSPEEENL